MYQGVARRLIGSTFLKQCGKTNSTSYAQALTRQIVSVSTTQRNTTPNASLLAYEDQRHLPCNGSFNLLELRKGLEISMPPLLKIQPVTIVKEPLPMKLPEGTVDFFIDTDPIEPTKAPVQDPTVVIKKEAARLIVIRRNKMKRHKLKKLRKKMKYVWAKIRQRREMNKEKAFHVELMSQIHEAEKFKAEAFAKNKIEKANVILLPKLWKGKRLPQFVIEDLIEEKKHKHLKRLDRIERRRKNPVLVKDYLK